MYLRTPPALPIAPRTGWPTALAFWSCAGLSLILGCLPAPIARAGRQAAEAAVALPEPTPAPTPVAAK